MIDNLKKILNEDQDPKAIEKIAAKLENFLMSNEDIKYIAVQKKPAVTILPESIVVTNKRIILCKPKNLGLSMEFVDYQWGDVEASFVKEGILGSDFTFSTKSESTYTVDYLPKNQARKLHTFAKEQLDLCKNAVVNIPIIEEPKTFQALPIEVFGLIETVDDLDETPTEVVINFAEIIPAASYSSFEEPKATSSEKGFGDLSQDELFAKLQNYKRLLDNGLILQGEYDALKKEILSFM